MREQRAAVPAGRGARHAASSAPPPPTRSRCCRPVPAPPPPPLTNPFDVPGEESIPACEQPKLGGRAKLKKGEEGKVEGASASDPCAAARKKDAAPAPGPSGSAEEGASNPFDGADVPPA